MFSFPKVNSCWVPVPLYDCLIVNNSSSDYIDAKLPGDQQLLAEGRKAI